MNKEQERLMKILTGKVFEEVSPKEKLELMDILAVSLGGIIIEGARDVGYSVYIKPIQHGAEKDRVGVVIVAEGEDARFIHTLVTGSLKAIGRRSENLDGASPIIEIESNSTTYH